MAASPSSALPLLVGLLAVLGSSSDWGPRAVTAIDNGLGLTPPKGWRSWNFFLSTNNQSVMEAQMRAAVDKSRLVDGRPTSLAELGWDLVAMDDGWQKCNCSSRGDLDGSLPMCGNCMSTGACTNGNCGGGCSYHDDNGTDWPNVDVRRFPDISGLVKYGHDLGLRVGSYLNNCICAEGGRSPTHYTQDVAWLIHNKFDGVKVDNCGSSQNMSEYARLLNLSGRSVQIENCHNPVWHTSPAFPGGHGDKNPFFQPGSDPQECPMNMYRTGGDIGASFSAIIGELYSLVQYTDGPVPYSYPGCFAYPDMNEVGNFKNHSGNQQRDDEEQSHWGLWSIVSAPMVLGFDMNDSSVMDRVWPTITNRHADAVNAAWFGRPGTLIRQYMATNTTMLRAGQHPCDGSAEVTGWKFLADGRLQAPTNSRNMPGLAKCLTTQGGDSEGGQQWPFTSPVPTSHGQYNGVLHEVGVGQQIVNCSSAQVAGSWSINASNGELFHLPPHPTNRTKPTCFSAKPPNFHTGAFFGGPAPSVTQADQCSSSQKPANTSTFKLTAKDELQIGDGSICVSAIPLYGLQLWSKPLNKSAVAALVLNLLPKDNQSGSVPLAHIPGYTADMTLSQNVWTGNVTPLASGATEVAVSLRPHQSAYFILSTPPALASMMKADDDQAVLNPSDGTRTQCAMRQLSYERGLELQPFRGALPELYGHNDIFENNHCIITGCRSSVNRSDHHSRCQEQIGSFHCDGSSPTALASSMLHSWTLRNNTYYTRDGNARLPCANLTVAAAATGGSGVEAGSRAFPLPSDAELVAMARKVLGMKTDDASSLPSPPLPAPPVLILPGPYNVSFVRANGNRPFISSHFPMGTPGASTFTFNLVPSYLQLWLPNGGSQDALIVRSVNGSSWSNGTTSTTLNPDKLTLTTFTTPHGAWNMSSVEVQPIRADSVILEPSGAAEACGVQVRKSGSLDHRSRGQVWLVLAPAVGGQLSVDDRGALSGDFPLPLPPQDPRIVYNTADGTYIMTYCVYGPPLPVNPKTNPQGIKCGGAGVGIATSKTPQLKESWVRHGYNCHNGTDGTDNCGKSAAILIRESGLHYMFWGIPTIAVSVSHDLLNWTLLNSSWVTPSAAAQEMWVEAGSPPQLLSDGNYIMSCASAADPTCSLRGAAAACRRRLFANRRVGWELPGVSQSFSQPAAVHMAGPAPAPAVIADNIADGDLWWGIGYLVLDGSDPTKILQRESRMLWPTFPWERADPSDPATSWEAYKNCIGAMNSLHALPGETDAFVGYYVGGDSVSGAAKISVDRGRCYPAVCTPPPPPPAACVFLPNTQLYDPGSKHTLPPQHAANESACCQLCMARPSCTGAVLLGTACYRKTAELPRVKQQGVTACVRKDAR